MGVNFWAIEDWRERNRRPPHVGGGLDQSRLEGAGALCEPALRPRQLLSGFRRRIVTWIIYDDVDDALSFPRVVNSRPRSDAS